MAKRVVSERILIDIHRLPALGVLSDVANVVLIDRVLLRKNKFAQSAIYCLKRMSFLRMQLPQVII